MVKNVCEWLFSFWSRMIVNEAINVHECFCAPRLGMVINCYEWVFLLVKNGHQWAMNVHKCFCASRLEMVINCREWAIKFSCHEWLICFCSWIAMNEDDIYFIGGWLAGLLDEIVWFVVVEMSVKWESWGKFFDLEQKFVFLQI